MRITAKARWREDRREEEIQSAKNAKQPGGKETKMTA
jgi:hypothetical protein